MAQMLRSLAVMGLVAGVGLVAAAATAGARPDPASQEPAAEAAPKKKGPARKFNLKAGKKGMTKAAMPGDGDGPGPAPADDGGGLKFSRDIAPILVANCVGCHKEGHQSGLNQSTFDGLMKGGKSGKVIQPGNADESLIVLRIKGEGGLRRMPPGNARLSERSVERIAQWVKEGAALDPGRDASTPLAKYAPTPEDLRKAELARLSPDDRDKKTEAAARDRLKRADPKANPEMTSSPHFLLFAEMPKERASALLRVMEAQHARVSRLLGTGRGAGGAGAEKVGLYVFKDTKGFIEFVRTIEGQEVEAGEDVRAKLTVESPYLIALDPLAGAAEPAGGAARRAGRTKKGDDGPGGPDRSLAGLLTEGFVAATLAQAGKPPRWLTSGVGALIASAVEPRSPYYRKLRGAAYDLANQGWSSKATEALGDQAKPETVRAVGLTVSEWLAGTDPALFANFVHGMLQGGEKLDETIRDCLDGTRPEFLMATEEFVKTHYGRGR